MKTVRYLALILYVGCLAYAGQILISDASETLKWKSVLGCGLGFAVTAVLHFVFEVRFRRLRQRREQ